MGDVINNFGSNAGKVWNTLNQKGPLTEYKIMKATKLNKYDFYTAVGWLAREDKICLTDKDYSLGETNFAENIGKDAGKIFDLLNTFAEIDMNFIQKITGFTPENTYYALGWLAREGKISAKKVFPKKPQIYLKLK